MVDDAYGPVNKITQIEEEHQNRSMVDDRTIDQANQLTDMNLVERSMTRLGNDESQIMDNRTSNPQLTTVMNNDASAITLDNAIGKNNDGPSRNFA